MNTGPTRVPNVETDERRAARLRREAVIAEQLAFLESFDRQVEDLIRRDVADNAHTSAKNGGSKMGKSGSSP